MRKTSSLFVVGGLALLLCACGGTDATVGDGGDGGGGGGDGGGGMDGAGMDGGGGNDSGGNDSGGSDSGGSDSGGDSGGGFTPGTLSCLVLWLDAAKGITQNNTYVSAWADQSGQGNNAAQSNGNIQPTIVMSVINSLPAVHFAQGQTSGNQLTVADSTSMRWGTGDFSLWVVARFNNNPSGGFATGMGLFYAKQVFPAYNQFTGAFLVGNTFANNMAVAGLNGGVNNNNVLSQTTSYNDNVARNYGLRRAGTTLELRANGQVVQTMSQNGNVDVSATNAAARIGAGGDTANVERLNGDIAEIVACKGATSSQDVTNVDMYLKSKYNLP